MVLLCPPKSKPNKSRRNPVIITAISTGVSTLATAIAIIEIIKAERRIKKTINNTIVIFPFAKALLFL